MNRIRQISAPVWTGKGPVARRLVTIEQGRIVSVQPDRPEAHFPDVRVWNDRHLIVPGLHDAHAHLLMGGLQLGWCHFQDVKTIGQFSDTLRDHIRTRAREDDGWVQGNGLDESVLRITRAEVDRVCGDLPVFIWTHDLHSAVASSQAMHLAGIREDAPDPPSGRFERDASGRLTGLLRESAAHFVSKCIPLPGESEARMALLRGQQYAFAHGVTAVSSSERADGWLHCVSFAHSAEHKIRFNIWRVSERFDIDQDRFETVFGDRFRAATLKGFVDGALGSRSAAMWKPYDDDRSNTGILCVREGPLARWVRAAQGDHYQIALHAIGDRANTVCLDAIEMASSDGSGPEMRARIEHAQFIREQDVPRYASLGVIASMQPVHCTSDMRLVEPRLGPRRAQSAYAWRSLLDAGAVLAFGSDWPVETIDPLAGIHAAVTRADSSGYPFGGWQPQQRISVEEALTAYTRGSAFAAFWEDEMGTIEAGKCADFAVLSRNILDGDAQGILSTEVVATIVGGEIVFEREAGSN